MTPQELRNSILQLAIQGKLVEQRPEEGTAEELYRQIQAEKARLIQEGKIKKEKPMPEIAEEEKPFEIPEGWKWVRLGSLISLLSGQDLEPSKYNSFGKGIPYITGASNICDSHIIFNRWTQYAQAIAKKGDLLLTCKGTVGKMAVLQEDSAHIARQIMALTPIIVNISYLKYYIESQIKQLKVQAKSMIPGIERNNVITLPCALPPITEQQRIAAKIEELLPYVDRYEQAWNRLEAFNKRFPDDMKKSILQLAIQGKLVEQRREEGTAEELYQEIQREKARLIKEGKIKKEKPLPEIAEEEKPFEIPEGWRWVYVGEIFAHNTGKAMNSSAQHVEKSGSIKKFITTSNLYWNAFDFTTVKEMFFSDDEIDRCTATKNDILMCEGGAYYGRTAIWNYGYDICFQNHIHRLRAYVPMIEKYFYYIFRFYRETGKMQSKGTAMPGLSSVALHHLVIPLPPLAEQKRIVERLDELLPICEKLK